ncbi:MAG: exosortase/archaeosortase family protein [Dissulfurispiraceae bacterium]|jgi:exosortase|nr:exosortase/archaeosortase family protein [Dissulfurispiraceae bacterium]
MAEKERLSFLETLNANKIWFILLALLAGAAYYNIVPSMIAQWYNDENYSHGFLVPLIAGYFFWQRRKEVMELKAEPSRLGVYALIFWAVMYILGNYASEYFTMRSSLIVLLVAVVLLFFGSGILKKLALPIGYLFLMVPIPYIIYDSFAFPLKLFVTKISVLSLKLMGIIVLREGNIIMFPNIVLEVADACSGMRSIMSLLALSVAVAFMGNFSNIKRWILILSAIPIAIATNAGRVIATGILSQFWGASAAEGFFHEFAGMAVFGVAMVMLIGLAALLRRIK